MKPRPTSRPAPRTLASSPLPPLRTPRPASCEARFPSLAVVLAGGFALPACEAPVCGTSRADELEAHGPQGLREARDGSPSRALRELGVALGVTKHGTTTTPDIPNAGAPPPVNPTPPTVIPTPPPMMGGGATPTVTPVPTPTPPTHNTTSPTVRNPGAPHVNPGRTQGRPMRVTPAPPRPTPQLEGDVVRVGPLPASLTTRRG